MAKYTQADFTKSFAKDMIETHGGRLAAAAFLAPHCVGRYDKKNISVRTVQHWLAVAMESPLDDHLGLMEPDEEELVNRIRKLVRESNIRVDAIGRISQAKLNSWGVMAKVKNPDGTESMETKDLFSTNIIIEPKEKFEPQWPIVQPAPPYVITYKEREFIPWSVRTHIVLPDHQVGFLRDIHEMRDGNTLTSRLHPIHDPRAIDVAQQIVADLQPDGLGHIGDFFDLTEMSRWQQHEEFFRTTQHSVDVGNQILADYEAAAGDPAHRETTWWIEGNHDRRFEDYLLKNARAAFGLRPADATPSSWPTSSIGHYVSAMQGFEYCGNYPGSEKWIIGGRNGLVARHNPLKRLAYSASVIVGHTHRLNRTVDTRRGQFGNETFELIESGCLCRVDDEVPRHRLMRTPVPSDRGHISGWSQSLSVITVDGERWDIEQPRFYERPDGKVAANFRGRVYVSAGSEL
jgi:hypothetical protein